MNYLLLFLSALLAATIFPAQSEALLVGLIMRESDSFWLLIAVATAGNTLGSVINWFLGLYLQKLQHYACFPLKAASLQRAQQQFQRYGWWSLLLSWVPIIGDPLTVIAGFMRFPLLAFTVLVALAKGGRYWALGAITQGLL